MVANYVMVSHGRRSILVLLLTAVSLDISFSFLISFPSDKSAGFLSLRSSSSSSHSMGDLPSRSLAFRFAQKQHISSATLFCTSEKVR